MHAVTDADVLSESERQALVRVAAAAAGAHDLEEVLELAAEEALRAIGAASLSVSRWDREEEALRTLINVGELGPGEERFPADETYAIATHPQLARMLQQGQPYFNAVDDPSSDPAAVRILRQLNKESDVAVPIVAEGEIWGEVWASTSSGQPHFRGTDVRFLEGIAGQLAVAIGRAELFSRVSSLAYEDPLTGLPNRRAIEERLDRATSRASRRDTELTVLLCDVDNLKAVNDSRGHEVGDEALVQVANALVGAGAGVPGSFVGRLSGDEFCVIVEGGGLDAARKLAATTLAALQRHEPGVSVSCGAAAAAAGTRTAEQLLRAADAAQYMAKRRGGSQFCTAEAGQTAITLGRGRRLFRGSAAERIREAAAAATELLESELAASSALDRLEAVTTQLAEAVNASAWAISFAEPGAEVIRSMCTADDRDSRLLGLRVGLEDEVYPLQGYPATARVVRAGNGTFFIDRNDEAADRAERELLVTEGHEAVLGVATSAADGVYLVELYADDTTAPLVEAELELRLLARTAIPPGSSAGGDAHRLAEVTRQVELTGTLGARLAGATEAEEIVRTAALELGQLGYAVCAIVRCRPDGLLEVVAESETGGPGRWDGWTAPRDSGLIGRALSERRTVHSPDVRIEPAYRATEYTRDIRAELDVPIRSSGRLWGAITVQERRVGAFSREDIRLFETVADQIGSALHSAELYEQLEAAYLGTAEALSVALEERDAYTASHSASIVRRAEAVGRELGMDSEELRLLRYGAAFHDIGKLAVPESILSKPGPLTPEERREVEQHTVVGERILAPVSFLAPVLPQVRHAHERWDGGGYPDRLAGDRIPLGARIIFACDAYDAMTTDRPYRRGMEALEAREELLRNAGTQFDPSVVSALVSVLAQDPAA
ncbi:MAG TPA: HD domain-containing phosphohydrolase [Thermoleophilaceae bacterium]